MENKKYYAVQLSGKRADIYIYGDIVTPDERWFEDETSAWSFKQEINGLDVTEIHVHINSYGGAISEGWAIYNALREHPAKIVTHADGFVASAAIYPFMAGEERIASNLSAFFFHQALAYPGYANADELRKAADNIEKLNDQGLEAFANAGVDTDYIRDLEKAETWIGPTEALDAGIATSVVADEGPKVMQNAKKAIMQKVLVSDKPRQKVPEPDPVPQKPAPINNSVMQLFKNF